MQNTKNDTSIFLCHANEDKAAVQQVYRKLKESGLDPWLDSENLLPGQVWTREISRAIKASRVFIIFLSSSSVSKRGYVQKEFKLALDMLNEIPEGQIFIIPVRLDQCQIPDTFRHLHYLDLFEANAFERLLRVVRTALRDDKSEAISAGLPAIAAHFLPTWEFMDNAGYTNEVVGNHALMCTSRLSVWADVTPLLIWFVLSRTLDLEEFRSLCKTAEDIFDGKLNGRTALVAISSPPSPADLHQIFALRAQKNFTIIPLPETLINQAHREGREAEVLREQIDTYIGRTDLYDISTAVTDSLSFFGRNNLLADLQRRLTKGHSAIIYGVRKAGKSSLLGRLREECDFPVAFVDLQACVGNFKQLYRDAIDGWVNSLETHYPELDIDEIVDYAGSSLLTDTEFRQLVSRILEIISKYPKRSSKRPGLVLFLDELDVVFTSPDYFEIASTLRGIAESSTSKGRFTILCACLQPLANRVDRFQSYRNPFFSFFTEVPIEPLESTDIHRMITSIGSQMGIRYSPNALELLGNAGGGHPFLTRQICSQTISSLKRPLTVDDEMARKGIDDYLKRARNYLSESLWAIDSGGPPEEDATILHLLATKGPLLKKLLIPSDLPPLKARNRHLALENLHDLGLVRPTRAGWKISIPLYQEWIQMYVIQN